VNNQKLRKEERKKEGTDKRKKENQKIKKETRKK
jgi:hypothetical protein